MKSFQAGVSLGFVAVVLNFWLMIYIDEEDCNQKFNTTRENSCVLKAIPRSEYEQIKQKYGVK